MLRVYTADLRRDRIVLFPLCLPQTRHRAVNLFLQGYEKSWIEAEEHYFEDKLIEDLAVSASLHACEKGRMKSSDVCPWKMNASL